MKPSTKLFLFLVKSAAVIITPAIHPGMTRFEYAVLLLALSSGLADKALAFFDLPEVKIKQASDDLNLKP